MVSRAFIISSIIAILSIFCVYQSIHINNLDLSYRDSGIIIDKFKPDKISVNKGSSDITTHLYLVVKYDRGKTEQTEVDANTWYNHKIGQRITFIQNHNYFGYDFKGGLELFVLVIMDIVAVIYIICLIVGLCSWKKNHQQNKGFWD